MKKTLLALCAGVLALCASAETFKAGEAFCYPINPDFKWFDGNEDYYKQNDNWPAAALQGQASMADGYGLGMVWFAQYNNGQPGPVIATNTLEEAMNACPVVQDPWNPNDYAIQMLTNKWWAFGNFNFALPQVGKLCRIRVIYRVDQTYGEVGGHNITNPIYVRLYNNGDQEKPTVVAGEPLGNNWETPGFRTVDIYHELGADNFYLAITFMPGGLSCVNDANPAVPFYLEEVSVVPVDQLPGNTHISGDQELAVHQTRPALVVIDGQDGISEVAVSEKAAKGVYDLQGRKVANATKGLYIIDGVKTLVK